MKKRQASVLLTFVALAGSCSIFVSDEVNRNPAINFTFWSWLLTAVFLFPFAIKQSLKQKLVIKQNIGILSILALLGASICSTAAVQALHKEQLVNAGLINGLTPVVIILLSAIFFRRWIGLRKAVGIACGIIAVILLILGGELSALKHITFNAGDGWMLLSVTAWAGYSILLDKAPASLYGLPFLFIIAVLGSVFLLPFELWSIALGDAMIVNSVTIIGLLFTSIITYVISYLGWNKGVKVLGPEQSGFYLNLFPVFAMILSVLFFHVSLAWYDIASLAFVLAGLYFVNKEK